MSQKKMPYEETKSAAPMADEPVATSTTFEPIITFEAYCAAKVIPEKRRPGMRTFTKVEAATLTAWEAIFKSY